MVDHRADDDKGLSFLVNARENRPWQRPGLLEQAREWLSDMFSPSQKDTYRTDHGNSDLTVAEWIRKNRLAVALSAIWTGVLFAYALGFFIRLNDASDGVRIVPTLDLAFFIFAIVGPVVMIWFVVAMLNRAAALSEAITGQSESALALAATINNLNDSVDALAMNTTGRLEQACDRMEREANASVNAMEKSLGEISQKLETALLDGVILMDSNLRERSERLASSLQDQQSSITMELRDSIRAIQQSLEQETGRVSAVHRELAGRTEQNLSETARKLKNAMGDLITQQKAGLGAANDALTASANGVANQLADNLKHQIGQIEAQLKTANASLMTTANATSATLRDDLGGALKTLRTEVGQMQASLAANPPATAQDLAALMGEAVHRIVSPERSALTQSVLRITALEEQARELLTKMDRTSRLTPLLEEPVSQNDPDPEPTTALFGALPGGKTRDALNWTAVVHILSGQKEVPGARAIVQQTRQDPDVHALIDMHDRIMNALGEHGLFIEDIVPEHAGANIWHAWINGRRDETTLALAGIRDNVSNAICRGWLRQNSANRALGLRYLQTYRNLLDRANTDIGADGRLVEMADTSAGRLFILLGGLNAIFGTDPIET